MNKINLSVPFFSQREIMYKWQNENDENEYFYIASVACNITSLCMLLNYLGITDDRPEQMAEKIFKIYKDWNTEPRGYDNLILWDNIKKIPNRIYGVKNEFIKDLRELSIESSEKYIQNGYPIMFSIGTLLKEEEDTTGHIAVLRGIKKSDYYIINDPWGAPENPFGLLNSHKKKLRGYYTARKNMPDILFGKGNGDNCILTANTFFKATGQEKNKKKCFNGAIAITYPHIYSFPIGNIKYGLKENIKETIYDTYRDNYNFLLSDNGLIIRGLRITKQANKKVHSVAAGRIVAIRNSKDIRYNFVLIQYRIPGNENEYFYVNYKHLEYIDIDREIKDRLFSESANTDARDYLSQIISKIAPKKGIYDKGESPGAIHEELNIPERGFSYFYPTKEKLKDFLFNVHSEESLAFDVNDISNYEIIEGGKKFYNVYTNSGAKRISPKSFIPQSMNYKEFLYYRKKLDTLSKGEITYFFDVDYKRTASEEDCVNEKNYKMYFIQNVKNIFNEVEFRGGEEYTKALEKVEEHYIKKINKEKSNGKRIEKIWGEFEDKCKLLCKSLLEIPWEEQEWAFTLNDRWFRGGKGVGDFIGVKDIYENVFYTFDVVHENLNSGDKQKERNSISSNKWRDFEKEVSLFYPSSFDDFIEASPFTIIGTATSDIEIECFSEANLCPDEKLLEFKDLKKEYNIKFLLENGIVEETDLSVAENYFYWTDVRKINNEKIHEYGKTVLLLFNPFAKDYEKGFIKRVMESTGINEKDESHKDDIKIKNSFPKNIAKALKKFFDFNSNCEKFYFYNIIEFLDYMHKKNIKVTKELA